MKERKKERERDREREIERYRSRDTDRLTVSQTKINKEKVETVKTRQEDGEVYRLTTRRRER